MQDQMLLESQDKMDNLLKQAVKGSGEYTRIMRRWLVHTSEYMQIRLSSSSCPGWMKNRLLAVIVARR